MGEVFRVCPACSADVPLPAQHCPNCGHDSRENPPARRSQLPVPVTGALVPLAAGVAGLVLRAGWKLLQNPWFRSTVASGLGSQEQSAPPAEAARPSPRRTIHIRSSWAVQEADGRVRQGREEHTIELD